jgi:hypothetical protein
MNPTVRWVDRLNSGLSEGRSDWLCGETNEMVGRRNARGRSVVRSLPPSGFRIPGPLQSWIALRFVVTLVTPDFASHASESTKET